MIDPPYNYWGAPFFHFPFLSSSYSSFNQIQPEKMANTSFSPTQANIETLVAALKVLDASGARASTTGTFDSVFTSVIPVNQSV